MSMKKNILASQALVAALLMAACGGRDPFQRKADPLTNYESLRKDVAPKDFKSSDQSFDGLLFDIRVDGLVDGVNQLNFYEGKTANFRIKSRVFLPEVAYSLKAHGLPAGARFEASKTDLGVYTLSWTPARGIINSGSESQKVDFKIEFVVEANTSARAKETLAKDQRNRLKEFTLNVSYSQSQPAIKLVGLDKDEFKVGDVVAFSVDVTDQNSTRDRRPDVIVTYDSANLTNEAKYFPATSAVQVNFEKQPEFKGNGRWVFHYLLDTTLVPQKFLAAGAKYMGGEFVIYSFNSASKMDSTRLIKRLQFKQDAVVAGRGEVQASSRAKVIGKAKAATAASAPITGKQE